MKLQVSLNRVALSELSESHHEATLTAILPRMPACRARSRRRWGGMRWVGQADEW